MLLISWVYSNRQGEKLDDRLDTPAIYSRAKHRAAADVDDKHMMKDYKNADQASRPGALLALEYSHSACPLVDIVISKRYGGFALADRELSE